jgi:predicted nucleic acid-binding protein
VAVRELVYLDASAFVTLAVQEPDHEALQAALDPWPVWVSSALLEVEATLAARRRGPRAMDLTRQLLGTVALIEIDAEIRRAAGDLPDPSLRSLDAIHLATALSLGDRCSAFFAYDERLIAAARAHGLTVTVPRP